MISQFGRRTSIFATCLAVGLFLQFYLADHLDELSVWSLVSIISGFFLSFIGMTGLTATWIRATMPPMTKIEGERWQLRRMGGRKAFVRRFVFIGLLPCLALLAFAAWNQGLQWGVDVALVVFVAFAGVIIVLSLIGAARAIWTFLEREHADLMRQQSDAPTNSSE